MPPARPLPRGPGSSGPGQPPPQSLARGLGAGSPGAGPCQRRLRISSVVEAARGDTTGAGPALPCRQKASGRGMAGMALPLCLILAAALQSGLTRAPGPPARPGPLLLRLRRLEEQFLRLQEVTLNHLQGIASNYNISYNIDGRFQALAEQAEAADAARAALGAELARLATAGRRLRRRLKRLEGTVGALSPHRLLTHPPAAPLEAGTEPHGLPDAARSRGRQLEQQPPGQAVRSTPGPRRPKTRRWQQHRQEEGHWLPAAAGPGGEPGEDEESPRDAEPAPQTMAAVLPTVTTGPQEQPPAPRQPGEPRHGLPAPVPPSPACRTGAVLLFPNTSAEHGAVLGLGPHRGLRAVSLCAWLATPAPRLGALLSYATEDGHSELAVHGRGGDRPGSARFILGHGHFRELPAAPLLDGKWHHLCLTWCSGQGQYRFYVDGRLLAAGSGFQQGYEIPAGGSLVLGRGQDGPSMDLGAGEAFVGHLAGFALWRRALLPGEVARMATGRGLPRGPLLTLADASLRGGVRRAACPCLQRCLGRG
ncbi:pentraxin-4 [Onychostruthus taczanowskii]|uniref:pentraxin-4 n=1 Tax=Onychostruthus taczanowskii TaxID=356909 RepID=UPI001B8003ED|nr:pentraxin-4 [Onychostruthus taczanowskii]